MTLTAGPHQPPNYASCVMCCISQEEALLSAFAPRLLHLEHVKLSAQRSRWPICPALTVLFSHAPLYLSPPCYYIFPLAHSDFLYDECPHLTHFQFLPIIYSVFGQSCASHSLPCFQTRLSLSSSLLNYREIFLLILVLSTHAVCGSNKNWILFL